MSVDSLRQEIWGKIAKLPENRLRETLNFVSFLLFQEQREPENGHEQEPILDPAQDPLLEYIGKVSHGSLAQDIDKELYGT